MWVYVLDEVQILGSEGQILGPIAAVVYMLRTCHVFLVFDKEILSTSRADF